jgi:hypothetical protein
MNMFDKVVHKDFNTFYHPMSTLNDEAGLNMYDSDYEMEWQIQCGNRLYPEQSVRSVCESYYQLLKCMGILNSSFHSIDINGEDYRNYKFIIGMDFERVLNAGFSGLNTKSGDLILIKTKTLAPDRAFNPTGFNPPVNASKMHIVLHADMVLNISESGLEVFE